MAVAWNNIESMDSDPSDNDSIEMDDETSQESSSGVKWETVEDDEEEIPEEPQGWAPVADHEKWNKYEQENSEDDEDEDEPESEDDSNHIDEIEKEIIALDERDRLYADFDKKLPDTVTFTAQRLARKYGRPGALPDEAIRFLEREFKVNAGDLRAYVETGRSSKIPVDLLEELDRADQARSQFIELKIANKPASKPKSEAKKAKPTATSKTKPTATNKPKHSNGWGSAYDY